MWVCDEDGDLVNLTKCSGVFLRKAGNGDADGFELHAVEEWGESDDGDVVYCLARGTEQDCLNALGQLSYQLSAMRVR